MKNNFLESIQDNPIIAAITDIKYLDDALEAPSQIIFLLTGSILNLKEIVNKLKEKEKIVFVHIDLIDGLSKDTSALEFISQNVKPQGIISTKSNLIKYAKNLGLLTVQRLFIIDSLALESGITSIKNTKPDAVEIMPGIMPRIISEIKAETRISIIAGGLIREKSEVIDSLNAGASGISTTNMKVWYM